VKVLRERRSVEVLTKWEMKIKVVMIVRNKRVRGSPARIEDAVGKEVMGYFEIKKEGRRGVSIRISDKYKRLVEVSLIVKF
jgi:hypothetical protein